MLTFLRNNQSIAIDTELVTTTCWCGVHLAIPRNLWRWARGDEHNAVFCPLGHEFVYGDSDRKKLEAAEARERHLKDQLEAAAADAEATRVKLIRDRHRFANGVCPCCNRSFENVARHMRTQHPDFDPADLTTRRLLYNCSCGRRFETPRGLATHQGHMRGADWADPSTSKWRAHLTVTK